MLLSAESKIETSSRVSSETPRVCLLTDSYAFAGTEQHMLELALNLREKDVSVSIACPEESVLFSKCADLQIDCIAEPLRFFPFRMLLRLRLEISRGKFNLVHAHNGVSHLIAALATKLPTQEKAACLITQHFVAPARMNRSGFKSKLLNQIHLWVSDRTDRFIAISSDVVQTCRQIYRESSSRIVLVYNGIGSRSIGAEPGCRKAFGFNEDAPLISTVSRLTAEKKVAVLVEAVKILRAEFPNIQCAIIGDGNERHNLSKLISDSNLENTVRLLGYLKNPFALVSSSDVFVQAGDNEGFGLALLEAMSLEKAVVAAEAGGPKEIVEDKVSGLFFEPNNPNSLAQKLKYLLTHHVEARAFAKAARQRYLASFTAERMAEQTIAVYQQCLGGRDFK